MTQVHVGLVSAYSYPQVPTAHTQQPQQMHPPSSADMHQQYQTWKNPPTNPYAPQAPTQSYYTTPSGTPITPTNYYQPTMQNPAALTSPQAIVPPSAIDPRTAPSGMFTRNLIGSLCVSAFKLTDPDGVMGIWFILQDLSVRTEGSFRYLTLPTSIIPQNQNPKLIPHSLKMNFVNVGSPSSPQQLNSGSAPVLASTFSNVFQVFSAKKFPGVIESTALSKCFAIQGIKIPIRKDGPRPREGGGGGDGEDDE